MPAAVMTNGTIMGEISIDMISRRYGISDRLRPMAANVPRAVDSKVAHIPMKKLFRMARIHCPLFHVSDNHAQLKTASGEAIPLRKISSYQRIEKASGSKFNMPVVKLKYGSTLKDNGNTIKIGRIKNKKMRPQIHRKV